VYFHGLIILSGSKFLSFSNESEEYILQNLVIPFINGQVINSNYGDGKILINMKSAITMSIYKSNEQVDEDKFRPKNGTSEIADEFKALDCTSEFIERVKELQSHPAMRSLLEIAFQPPEKQIFVVMKFGNKILDSAYEGVIKPLCSEYGFKIVRVDEIQDSGKINDQILENIAKSSLIISDLSGERPNCYYETGFAHALGKDIVLAIHKTSDIHFDLSSHRFIQWETESEYREALRARFDKLFVNKN
jgi:hypothetical protein